ncbi:MAG: polyphosphate kinase 2 family protein, partial [Undibacterium sp.]|nr:polyphosphate kinase 2 family protein [Undibacterium sp.]
MSAVSLFRAKENLHLLDQDADLRLLSKDSDGKSKSADKAADKLQILRLGEQLAEYQNILYAQKKCKVLVILQGMDTAGKDGTIRGVFG